MAMNNCSFTGRLTADPRMDYVGQDQVEKVTFSLAVDRDRRKEDGSRETDFLDFVAWRGTAKFISEHFSKGDAMTVTNVRETVREYVDRDGVKHRKHEHEISPKSDIYFGSRRRDRAEGTSQRPAQDRIPEADYGGYSDYYSAGDEETPF